MLRLLVEIRRKLQIALQRLLGRRIVPLVLIDLGDLGKLVVRQREVEDVDVVADVINVLGAGDHHVAHLCAYNS